MLILPAQATKKDDGLLTACEVTQLKLDAEWVIVSPTIRLPLSIADCIEWLI